MKIYLIRHGATFGNREKRYVGTTDESLLNESVQKLQQKNLPKPDRLYVSPLKRCKETAQILYPNVPQIIVEHLKECNFGAFEYCNYKELNGNLDYQAFIDSGGEIPFPDGETKQEFKERCNQAFLEVVESELQQKEKANLISFVVHGGTIMAILDKFSVPHKDYYEWQVGNATGFVMDLSIDKTTEEIRLTDIQKIAELEEL